MGNILWTKEMSIKLKNTNSSLVHLSQFCSYISQFYLIYLSSLYYTFPYTYLISLVNYLISLVLFTSVLYFNPSLYFSRSLVLPELSQFFILIASVLGCIRLIKIRWKYSAPFIAHWIKDVIWTGICQGTWIKECKILNMIMM